MPKYNYMKITGEITVTVDAVDIEQEIIAAPQLEAADKGKVAALAAIRKEGYLSIARAAFASGFELHQIERKRIDAGAWEIVFKVSPL